MPERKLNFEYGDTYTFWSEKLQRFFTNSLLDKHWKDDEFLRATDKYGDAGWIVGQHKGIEFPKGSPHPDIGPYFLWVRDRDKAEIGLQLCNLESVEKDGRVYSDYQTRVFKKVFEH